MYTVDEVASYLKVSKTTIYRLASRKKISCRKIGGQLRFTKKDIAAYSKVDVEEIDL